MLLTEFDPNLYDLLALTYYSSSKVLSSGEYSTSKVNISNPANNLSKPSVPQSGGDMSIDPSLLYVTTSRCSLMSPNNSAPMRTSSVEGNSTSPNEFNGPASFLAPNTAPSSVSLPFGSPNGPNGPASLPSPINTNFPPSSSNPPPPFNSSNPSNRFNPYSAQTPGTPASFPFPNNTNISPSSNSFHPSNGFNGFNGSNPNQTPILTAIPISSPNSFHLSNGFNGSYGFNGSNGSYRSSNYPPTATPILPSYSSNSSNSSNGFNGFNPNQAQIPYSYSLL